LLLLFRAGSTVGYKAAALKLTFTGRYPSPNERGRTTLKVGMQQKIKRKRPKIPASW